MYRGSPIDKTGTDSVSIDSRKKGPYGNSSLYIPIGGKHHHHQKPQHAHAYHQPQPPKCDDTIDGGVMDFIKGLKNTSPDLGDKSQVGWNCARIFSAALHTTSWVMICIYWANIGNSGFHERLYSNSFTMTNPLSMVSILTGRGYITPIAHPFIYMGNRSGLDQILDPNPGFKELNGSSVLEYAQPVLIQVDSAYGLGPSKACTNHMLVNNNTAIWSACTIQDIPSRLVDIAYQNNTLMPFGSNNILAIIYYTMFLTMALSIAALPPVKGQAIGVYISLLLIIGSFIFVVISPFTAPRLHTPPNNAIIGAILHFLTASLIMMMAKPRNNEHNNLDNNDGKTLRYLGKHLVATSHAHGGGTSTATSNLWGKMVEGQVQEIIRFTGEPLDEHDLKIDTPFSRADQIIAHAGNKLATISKDLIKHDWVQAAETQYTMVNFRYFEFSMTAGLFLVCSVLSVNRTANVHVVHMAYISMVFCNLLGACMTKALVFRHNFLRESDRDNTLSNFVQNYGIWLYMGIGALLVAAFVFFGAGMTAVLMTAAPLISQAPTAVIFFFYGTIAIYFLFALAGGVCLFMLLRCGSKEASFKNISYWQLGIYEALNLGKAILAIVFVTSVVVATV